MRGAPGAPSRPWQGSQTSALLGLSTQIRDFCYFLSPKYREFGGITVLTYWCVISITQNTIYETGKQSLDKILDGRMDRYESLDTYLDNVCFSGNVL